MNGIFFASRAVSVVEGGQSGGYLGCWSLPAPFFINI